jgi:site-specific DNA recombinase
MNKENPVFAAIYARTSPSNRSNYSIEEQVNQCWDYCNKRGWTIRYVFIDEDKSGKTVERAKFQLMLEKAKEKEFSIIVFWKLDRFCRSLADLVNIERALRQYGVELCSVTEFIDTTTSVGRFNYRNLASVAELERELIGERARLGLYALAREHKWPNSHPPLGYDRDEDGRLVINEREAELVRRVFEMYINEKSLPRLAFELNTNSVPTKKNGRWSACGLREALTNEIYVGKYRVAGVEDYVEEYRIVSDEVFQKAKETMARYTAKGASRPPMNEDRRMMKIEKVFNTYFGFLRTRREAS